MKVEHSLENDQKMIEAMKNQQPLTIEDKVDLLFRHFIQEMDTLDTRVIPKLKEYYPEWEKLIGKRAYTGFKFTYQDDVYEVTENGNGSIFIENWVPGVNTASLYQIIPVYNSGSYFDPIPYKSGMIIKKGLHYTQDSCQYEGLRDSINPVFESLSFLSSTQGGEYVQKEDAYI